MIRRSLSILLALALLCSLMPAAFAAPEDCSFADVPTDSWFYEAVQFAVENELMNGVGDGRFEPNTKMSRAMLVTVLWRYGNSPQEGTNSFSDVDDSQWYTQAVSWAAYNELVMGVGGNRFDPNGSITREQLAVLIYRFNQWLGADADAWGDVSEFSDADKISDWAYEGVCWAVGAELMRGTGSGLNPKGEATRAEVATILMRFIKSNQDIQPPAACEHSETELRNAAEPTCTTDGYSGDVCCRACGYCVQSGVVIAMLGHSYVNGACENCGSADNAESSSISIAGKIYTTNMSVDELLALAGEPDEILETTYTETWYVFGTTDYTDFFMASVRGDKVVSLCATGVGFVYQNARMGDTVPEIEDYCCECVMYTDSNANDTLLAVLLAEDVEAGPITYTPKTLEGESRMNFHMTNAFRVFYGKSILTWSDAAATAARMHSEDMANQNYFSHYSLDGRTPGDRLSAQGIAWRSCSENICAGFDTGISAFDGWVNSAGHRSNMLSDYSTHMGVGFAYNGESYYRVYATQNYFS